MTKAEREFIKTFNQYKMDYERRQKEGKTFEDGVRFAAELANHYNSITSHPYMLGDCILFKLNMLTKKKIRKNLKSIKKGT